MMLTLTLPPNRYWAEDKNQFISHDGGIYHLEHSLKAVFKWEGLHKKPFLTASPAQKKSLDDIVDYVICMCEEDIDKATAYVLLITFSEQITNYINESQTATTIKRTAGHSSSEGLSAELLYYYIGQAQIPIVCENWHISRLLTILEIAGEKNKPPKKMGRASTMRSNAALNRARRAGRPG